MSRYTLAALYKFAELPNYKAMQLPLRDMCQQNSVKGTLLLAEEGINGTIAGPLQGMDRVLAYLKSFAPLADLEYKLSYADDAPFYRLKVRLKKENVTLGLRGRYWHI